MALNPLEGTKFWELTGLFLSLIQMLIALEKVEDYEDKLVKLADTLFKCGDSCDGESLAMIHRCKYFTLRALDKDFRDWYYNIPTYQYCESGIHRGKGRIYQELGSSMRKLSRMNNGYTPLAMVGKVSAGTMGLARATGSIRAQNYNAEQKRKMEDQLLHWKAIVSIPVEQEGNYANFGTPIKVWSESMGEWGRSFNNAAGAFGSSLYNLIHSGNQNQINYGPIPTSSTGQQAITIGWPNNVARRP